MSTCIHNNYPKWEPNPIKKNDLGSSSKKFNNIYVASPPHNPVEGSIYFDTKTNKQMIYTNQKWMEISEKQTLEIDLIDEFDILIESKGFMKVRLYQELPSGKRGIELYDSEEQLFMDETDKVLDFIKDNVREGYLWIEKRILQHLG